MKKISVLFVSLVILSACSGDKYKAAIQSDPDAPQEFEKIKSDPISVRQAAEMTSRLLIENPELKKLAKNKAIGGLFLGTSLVLGPDKKGVLFWHCYNPDHEENGFPELFLAMEQVKEYDSVTPQPKPENAMLELPLHTFVYDKTSLVRDAIIGYFLDHNTSVENARVRQIDSSLVIRYTRNFVNEMKRISPNANDLYCLHPHAFFIDNQYYQDFMGENPSFVRYYMGLAIDQYHKPNYYRPILAGVNSDGETIVTNRKRGDNAFLQKSWPPANP